jgi:membrane protease subunit HflK
VGYSRTAGVGFRPDLDAVANRRQLTDRASDNLWHSPVTAASTDPRTATYLTGDENLLEISFAVLYGLADPRAYFYRLDKDRDPVRLYAEATAREFVARQTLDTLLTSGRAAFEAHVAAALQERLDAVAAGVTVAAVLVVDIHPPQGAVQAFRDVSSAREDRETAINKAASAQAKDIPLARGQAALDVASARAAAATAETVARGQADALRAQTGAFTSAPALLGDLLWLETAERVLAGRAKLIVPPGSAGQHLVVWKDAPPPSGPLPQPARGPAPQPPAATAPAPRNGE